MMDEFNQKEVMYVNELVKFNNEYVGLLKQKEQYDSTIKQLQEQIKRVRKGFGFPLVKAIGRNVFETIPIAEKKEVIAEMLKQLSILENSAKGIDGQLIHKRDEFEGAALKVYRFLFDRFGNTEDGNLGKPVSYDQPSLEAV